ncbi:AmmeMemoRadiSam system protein B [bacterium]|nr:AmmeMemoRadiSam system protein B [bacterium]
MKRTRCCTALPTALVAALLLALAACGDAASRVREPIAAGTFYESDPAKLRAQVDDFLAMGAENVERQQRVIALVAPHAGYVYSGRCAGHAYAAVKGQTYKRVVLLAVNHRGRNFRGASILDVDTYRTPLGDIPVDTAACKLLLKSSLIHTEPSAHRREHSLEVHLPFLQRAIGSFRLVPIVTGFLEEGDFPLLAATIRQVVDNDTLVVESTDFTHYGRAFGFTPFRKDVRDNIEKLDKGAIDLILSRDAAGFWDYVQGRAIKPTICGRHPLRVLIHMLPDDAEGKLVCYYCSGDAERNYTHSVSYASIVFAAPKRWSGAWSAPTTVSTRKTKSGGPSLEAQQRLLEIARQTLVSVVNARGVPGVKEDSPELQGKNGVFVTLKRLGKLRGCIGCFESSKPLYQTVARETRASALEDLRFKPVMPKELREIEIEVSVLSASRPIANPLDWEFGTHGIIVKRGPFHATFLPQVADHFKSKEQMLAACCRKAGLTDDAWKDPKTQVKIYDAFVFNETDVRKAAIQAKVAALTKSRLLPSAGALQGPAASDTDSAAVVIGVADYVFLGKAPLARPNAQRVADLLRKTRRIAAKNLSLMTGDSPANLATKEIVLERVRQCASTARGDGLALVYFSGHAARRGNSLLVVPADCKWERGIAVSDIVAELRKSRAPNRVLVLDVCHAGLKETGVDGVRPDLVPVSPHVAIFVACGDGERSLATSDGKGTAFTRAFTDAIATLADEPGAATAKDVQRKLAARLRGLIAGSDKKQTAALYAAPNYNPVLVPPTP